MASHGSRTEEAGAEEGSGEEGEGWNRELDGFVELLGECKKKCDVKGAAS